MKGLSPQIPTFDKSFSYEYQKKGWKSQRQYSTLPWLNKCSSMLLEDKVTFDTIWTFFGELRSSRKPSFIYSELVYKPQLGTRILLFELCEQPRVVRKTINLSIS